MHRRSVSQFRRIMAPKAPSKTLSRAPTLTALLNQCSQCWHLLRLRASYSFAHSCADPEADYITSDSSAQPRADFNAYRLAHCCTNSSAVCQAYCWTNARWASIEVVCRIAVGSVHHAVAPGWWLSIRAFQQACRAALYNLIGIYTP